MLLRWNTTQQRCMVAQHIFETAGMVALILVLYLHLKKPGMMKNNPNNKNNKLGEIGKKYI